MHPEALNQDTKAIFRKLGCFKDFYLAGGTALALQVGHRISIDFDFFSKHDIPGDQLIEKLEKLFSRENVRVVMNHSEQLSTEVYGVKLTFAKYRLPVLLGFIQYQNVHMVTIPEIAAMKAYSAGRRPSLKDYVDLYYIVSEKHTNLPQIIELAQQKFKKEFEPRLFL